MNLNKAFLFGNLTRDPELKSLPSGIAVASFGLATNRRTKRDGQWIDQPEFHNVVTFGKTAELVSQHMRKGSSMFVEGRIQTRSWEKDGTKVYRTEVVAERVQFGPKRDGVVPEEEASRPDTDGDDPNPDDIPF